ncbi:MAG: glycosyltransferase [Parcubacteria group bacterium Licking1014_17]|nr:MAG: glycosyltransferase [Parcubacteria group bacterium Licking1014_17]
MKLLIFVNKLDENDDLLGFFPGWVYGLARNMEKISVITQHAGRFENHPNIAVYSLDKKNNPSLVGRMLGYWRLLWRLRGEYDLIFAFMAPIWAIASAPAKYFLGKKLVMWYAVWKDSLKLRKAAFFCDKIITSVPEAFPFKTKKLAAVGQGIDISYFTPNDAVREKNSLLFLGRISPIKKLGVLLSSLKIIGEKNPDIFSKMKLAIAGGASSEADEKYLEKLKNQAKELRLEEKISWLGRISHKEISPYYQRAEIFINLTPTGSFDKTILEAMSSGCLVLASNKALQRYYDEDMKNNFLFKEGDADDLAAKLSELFKLPESNAANYRKISRDIIIRDHSKENLVEKLVTVLKAA